MLVKVVLDLLTCDRRVSRGRRPGIAPSASCLTHAPSLRLRVVDPCLALLGLCAGAGGRRLWRHPAGWGLRGQGASAALRRGSCGGKCGLRVADATTLILALAPCAASKRRQAVPPNFVGVTDIAIFIFLPVFCFV